MLLLMDANVLIDYAKTDRQVSALVVQVLGPAFVATPLFDEVQQLMAEEARTQSQMQPHHPRNQEIP